MNYNFVILRGSPHTGSVVKPRTVECAEIRLLKAPEMLDPQHQDGTDIRPPLGRTGMVSIMANERPRMHGIVTCIYSTVIRCVRWYNVTGQSIREIATGQRIRI